MSAVSVWRKEEIALAAALWNDNYTAAEIVEKLWTEFRVVRSRNSIVGLAHRHRDLFERKGRLQVVPKTREELRERITGAKPEKPVSRMKWVSPEEKAHAADMWRNGHTLREIGEALAPRFGTKRTVAMLGIMLKEDRDAFPARKPGSCANVVAARIEARREERTFQVPPERIDRAEAEAYDASSRHVPLADLDWKDCHWPVNDAARGEMHLFCGHQAEKPYGYCAHHALRAWGEGTRGENAAARTLVRMGRAA